MKLPIFIWGGGQFARDVTECLRENDISDKITYVVDDEFLTSKDKFLPLSKYLDNYAKDSVMVFGFYNYKIIQEKKEQYDNKITHLYDFHFTVLNGKRLEWNKNDVVKRLSEFWKTYTMLKDKKSKKTMELYLKAAVNGEFDKLYETCHEDTAYFNSMTNWANIQILVDCGAFDGDSIHDFVNVFPHYSSIYAIEPDSVNREKLNERIQKEKIRDIIIIPKGVYSESTTLHFSSAGNSASHMDEKGDVLVPVITLDELLEDCYSNIFIKMDIEGSEMNALAGATKTIASKHPYLAICVYHKETDLIDIPQYIDTVAGSDTYDYYLRFHGFSLAELVLYAVPRK